MVKVLLCRGNEGISKAGLKQVLYKKGKVMTWVKITMTWDFVAHVKCRHCSLSTNIANLVVVGLTGWGCPDASVMPSTAPSMYM